MAAGGVLAVDEIKDWQSFAERVRQDLESRTLIKGSKKNQIGHLKELALLNGPVCAGALEKWVLERSPVEEPDSFRNRWACNN